MKIVFFLNLVEINFVFIVRLDMNVGVGIAMVRWAKLTRASKYHLSERNNIFKVLLLNIMKNK